VTTVQREESLKRPESTDNATMTEKEDSAVLADIATRRHPMAVDIEDAEEESETAGAPPGQAPGELVAGLLVFGLLACAWCWALAVAAGLPEVCRSRPSRADELARIESVQAAKDSTTALFVLQAGLSRTAVGVRPRTCSPGNFRDSYTSLTHDVVIPGAQAEGRSRRRQAFPAVASVSAEPNHAVVLVFVNQRLVRSARVHLPTHRFPVFGSHLDKIGNRWLISLLPTRCDDVEEHCPTSWR